MSRPPSLLRAILPLFAAPLLACVGDAPPAGEPGGDTGGEPVGETYESFEAWKARLPRDPIDGAYLVEGDIGVSDDTTLHTLFAAHDQPGALVVNRRGDGDDDRWSSTQKTNLTYCVSTRFAGAHDAVAAAMESAGDDWAGAAAVRFVHRGGEDGACEADNTGVLFEVLPTHDAPYTARSFFPSLVPQGRHTIYVDLENIAHAAPKTLTGVLRHELGHVLGFRHEHARPEAGGVCPEGGTYRALTPYDPVSVMHYNAFSRCQGENEGDYLLTRLDRTGVESLYGAP